MVHWERGRGKVRNGFTVVPGGGRAVGAGRGRLGGMSRAVLRRFVAEFQRCSGCSGIQSWCQIKTVCMLTVHMLTVRMAVAAQVRRVAGTASLLHSSRSKLAAGSL